MGEAMSQPERDPKISADASASQMLAAELGQLFSGKDMAVVTAALAEAVSRCFAQMDEETAKLMYSAWERAMWQLCGENRALFRHNMAEAENYAEGGEVGKVSIREATHVVYGYPPVVEKIASKWGVSAEGELAKPSEGGFGVLTESGRRVDMFEARFYEKRE